MRIVLVAALLGLAVPAVAQTYSSDGTCPPPLKFAAGACVRECPAGYADLGRRCEFRNMSGGGGGR